MGRVSKLVLERLWERQAFGFAAARYQEITRGNPPQGLGGKKRYKLVRS